MAETLHRSQILLKREQHRRIEELAQSQGRSISDVTREVVDLGLAVLRQQTDQRQQALQRLASRRLTLPDVDIAEVLENLRDERDAQLEPMVEGHP